MQASSSDERKAFAKLLEREVTNTEQAMKKRNLFAELTEGLDALAAEREGKITLRKIKADALEVSPAEIKAVREASHASQAVMARSLRINVRTYQNMRHMTTNTVPRRATNISLPEDVYKDAKELGINFSQTCERAIRQAVQAEKDRQWAIKYADFIQAYNDMVERDGLPLAEYRTF